MSGKSWYEYKFDVIGQPGSNENGIYDIGNKYNSYDDCLSFIMEKFMEFISKQKDDDDDDKERLRVTQSVIFKTSGIIYGYLIGFLNARNEEINFKNKLKELTSEAFKLDVFGAPTFLVNNKLFWGQDRLEYAIDELKN